MFKIFILVIVLLAAAGCAFLFYQGRVSASQTPPVISANGPLPACPDKPNCVSSTAAATDPTHHIDPLPATALSMEALKTIVEQDGGTDISVNGNLLTARYKSRVFGFVDDLILLKTPQHTDVYSASRVGHSDLNANRQRVERLRARLTEAS
jgi:uncharacterized protein (DUF1499 family)